MGPFSAARIVSCGMTKTLIAVRNVTKTFPGAAGEFTALKNVTLEIDQGEFAVVVGQSGSGKSTLLALLAGIDRPTRGEVHVGGTPVHALRERDISAWRGRAVGIVFQFFQLLPTLTAAENVMLPMDFSSRWPANERHDRAMALLTRLGVGDQGHKLPATLSGGQQQRVAIARALANAPAVLLADEPTGNLDTKTSEAMLDVLTSLVEEGQTIVMVTHERDTQRFASRTITLADGQIVDAGAAAHV
jgi:putative ABC transport system ATP-binding protein